MKKNVVYIILVIFLVIFLVAAIVLGFISYKFSKQLEEEKNRVEDATNAEATNETKNEVIYSLPEFNSNKCANTEIGAKYIYNIQEEKYGVTCILSEDRKSVDLTFDIDKIKELYNIELSEGRSNFKVDNFGGKIVNIYADSLGHKSNGYEVILFLMADGSVEYIPIYKALKDNNIKSYGKVPVSEDIVSLFTVTVEREIAESYQAPGAMRSDGTFYDLARYLYNTGNFIIEKDDEQGKK